MQKLVWQNANGVELDLTSGNYGITEWEGFSNTGLNIQTQTVPFQDGGVFLDALIEQRELTVTLAIQDNNNLELRYQQRRELISALNPKLGEGYLIYTNDFISKRIKCIPNIPIFETHNSDTAGTPKASLSWVACEPYWEDLEETEVEMQANETINITNEGDVSCQIKAVLKGRAINPILFNTTSQKGIMIDGEFLDNIEIDTNIGNKKIEQKELGFKWSAGGLFNDCCYGQGKTIYVGDICVVEEEYSGKTIAVSLSVTLNAIIYENGKFIAVGNNGTVLISPDGYEWKKIIIENGAYNINDIIFNNGLYIVVGEYQTIYTSSDCITWVQRHYYSQSNLSFNAIAYGNGVYVTVGGTTRISTDGISWVSPQGSVGGVVSTDIAYGAGVFVIVGRSNYIYTTPDGNDWNGINIGLGYLYGISYEKNKRFVAVGADGVIITSQDGITGWTQSVSAISTQLNGIKYQNGSYVICGEGAILTSPDGIDITIKVGTGSLLNAIAYGNGVYVAVGEAGLVVTSTDKINWVTRNSGVYKLHALQDVIFAKGIFVAVGDYGQITISEDGINWTQHSSSNYYFKSITFANDKFYAVMESDGTSTARGYWKSSSDGINWTDIDQKNNTLFTKIIYVPYTDNTHLYGFFITTDKGIVYHSRNDTSSLSTSNTLVNTKLNCIEYEPSSNSLVVVGDNGVIMSSSGINSFSWTLQESGTSKNLNGIVRVDNRFIAVGDDSLILSSVDKISWQTTPSFYELSLKKIFFNNETFFIVGDEGLILESFTVIKNIISLMTSQSDMTFSLEKGNNKIKYMSESGVGATITYRQKYIGV